MILFDISLTGSCLTEPNYTFTLFVKKQILPEGRYSVGLVPETGRTFVHCVYFRQLKDMCLENMRFNNII